MTNTTAAMQRTGVPAAGRYRLDPSRSSVAFRTRHLFGLGAVSGTMAVGGGEITVNPAVPHASVTATMSAASFSTGNRARHRDVRSAKFLHAERYPDITLWAGTLSQAGSRWMLAGELQVRGVTNPVMLAIESVQAAGAGFRARATTRIRPVRLRVDSGERDGGPVPGHRPDRRSQAAVTAKDRRPRNECCDRRFIMSVPGTSLPPYVRQAGEHQRLAYIGGHELAIILDAAITGGQLTVIDVHARRGDASPVHVHGRDDEAFLLLDGEMTVWVGEARHELRPGGIAFLPRDIPHAVRYDIASRALVLSTPGGFQETVFRSAGWDLSRPRPEGWQPTQDALHRAAEQAGVRLIGPPHGLYD